MIRAIKRWQLEKFLRQEKVCNFRETDYDRIIINGTSPLAIDHFFELLEIPGISGWQSIRAIAKNSELIKEKINKLRKGRAEAPASIEQDEREIETVVDFFTRYVDKCDKLGFYDGIGKLTLLDKLSTPSS